MFTQAGPSAFAIKHAMYYSTYFLKVKGVDLVITHISERSKSPASVWYKGGIEQPSPQETELWTVY